MLEDVAGRRYGRLPHVGFRRGLEARLAGPWSQYLTLGVGPSRVVRMTSWAPARPALPTILAHELAHRFGFDESVTTLRGLEASARLAEAGDAAHLRAVLLELGRCALGAALHEAALRGIPEPVDGFFAGRAPGEWLRSRAHWERLRVRMARRRGPDWAAEVYAALPVSALEAAEGAGDARSAPLAPPRFRIDSVQAGFCAAITAADALSRRRLQTVPLGAVLRLWRGSAPG